MKIVYISSFTREVGAFYQIFRMISALFTEHREILVYMSRTKFLIDEKILHKLYIEQNLSPAKIGEKLGCSFKTVRNRIVEAGMPFKDPAIARIRSKRRSFDGTDEIKAYMIGFRIGDLNVYVPNGKSKTVVVRCHTTQADQVRIMEKLFDSFGKVTVSSNKGHYHVNCFLDLSFSFLIPKDETAWEQIRSARDSVVWGFIAGYVDAEANFILNQGRARFKIDAYDDLILCWISEWLETRGIRTSFRVIYQMGDIWRGTFPLNKDLWRLNINEMISLQKFIHMLLPYIKHEKRRRDMVICQNNIIARQARKRTKTS